MCTPSAIVDGQLAKVCDLNKIGLRRNGVGLACGTVCGRPINSYIGPDLMYLQALEVMGRK